MFKISFVIMLLASVFSGVVPVYAQTGHQAHVHAPVLQASPGLVWLSIEDNMRNLTDAVKKAEWPAILGYAKSMRDDLSLMQSAGIEGEVKPHEQEQLLNSFAQLAVVLDELIVVADSSDTVAIETAVNRVAGAVTLTRIDVPPGLLEKISGATVRAEIVNTPVLKKDVEETITLRLKNAVSGKPLKSTDLEVVHTQIVHALIIDPQLEDYKHVHPEEIDVPGEYSLVMTPKTDCTYRLWADVTLSEGKQEYALVDIPAKEGCGSLPIDKSEKWDVKTELFHAVLKAPEGGLKVGGDATLEVLLTDMEGNTLQSLEPIMGAYAHMVGFYDDYRTIAHLHPLGAEPVEDTDRGTGALAFHFQPQQAGFVKFFVQIVVDGQEHFFPFGVIIQE